MKEIVGTWRAEVRNARDNWEILQRTLFVERYCFRSELVEGKEENIFNKSIMVDTCFDKM